MYYGMDQVNPSPIAMAFMTNHHSSVYAATETYLELRALGKGTDLVLRGNVLENVVRVEVHELVRSILARVLDQDLAATRVIIKPRSDIVNITLDHNPGRVLGVVLLHFIHRKGLRHVG